VLGERGCLFLKLTSLGLMSADVGDGPPVMQADAGSDARKSAGELDDALGREIGVGVEQSAKHDLVGISIVSLDAETRAGSGARRG
jgi:hypothetical protein